MLDNLQQKEDWLSRRISDRSNFALITLYFGLNKVELNKSSMNIKGDRKVETTQKCNFIVIFILFGYLRMK